MNGARDGRMQMSAYGSCTNNPGFATMLAEKIWTGVNIIVTILISNASMATCHYVLAMWFSGQDLVALLW